MKQNIRSFLQEKEMCASNLEGLVATLSGTNFYKPLLQIMDGLKTVHPHPSPDEIPFMREDYAVCLQYLLINVDQGNFTKVVTNAITVVLNLYLILPSIAKDASVAELLRKLELSKIQA